jgi:hypothetical protein
MNVKGRRRIFEHRHFIGLIFLSWFFACSPKENTRTQTASGPDEESFEKFIDVFGSDSIFQARHIKYPLPYLFYDDDSDELSTRDINNGEWRFVYFADDSLGKSLPTDAFDVVVEKDSTTAKYSLKGIDNGILVVYEFTKDQGRWGLVKVTNASD